MLPGVLLSLRQRTQLSFGMLLQAFVAHETLQLVTLVFGLWLTPHPSTTLLAIGKPQVESVASGELSADVHRCSHGSQQPSPADCAKT